MVKKEDLFVPLVQNEYYFPKYLTKRKRSASENQAKKRESSQYCILPPFFHQQSQEYIHISLVHCEDKTPLIKNIRVKFIDTNLNGEDLPIERNGIDINDIELMGSHDIAVCTMIDSLSKYNTRLKEWLTYNILLGVEHFYIFDNRISSSISIDDVDHDLRSSILKPFIDANIVTLIYYPFIPTKEIHWNSIQRSTFQKMLQQFGHKNKWIGFFDIDEYFVPSVDIINQYYRTKNYSRFC